MISLLLVKKIAELFIYMLMGAVLVRAGLIKKEDSVAISTIALYLMAPCMMIVSFQVDLSETVRSGFMTAFLFAIGVHVVYIIIAELFARFSHGIPIETGSIIYVNSGNLILPIVSSVLGPEWVIYSSAYTTVFNIFIWTHGRMLFEKNGKFSLASLKKIFLNVNVISIIIGMIFLFSGVKITGIPLQAMTTVGSAIGPASMFVTGMLLGSMKLDELFKNHRIWLIILMRLLVCPLVILLIIKLFSLEEMIQSGSTIFLISFLAAMAPQAATINQFAILYKKDTSYASSINILSTLLCIGTMPLMVWLYEHI
ncbi:MAG: AEC family transporter [Lachnospiraceae bacterium]|nr:AEC family transporter [Lachnospiraceae bacterium]